MAETRPEGTIVGSEHAPVRPDALMEAVATALSAGRAGDAADLVAAAHYADAADVIERLDEEPRNALVAALGGRLDPDVLPVLDPEVRDQVIAILGLPGVAAAVENLESDDAVEVVEGLSEDERRRVIAALPGDDRAAIEQALAYPEESAGRMMQRELIAVPDFWTVGDTLDYLRRAGDDLPESFYEVFVVDLRHHPVGRVAADRLLRAAPEAPLSGLADPDVHPIPALMDREEVAMTFRDRDWVTAMVVDEAGRLIGRITVDDILDVIDEEAEDDMLRLGGVRDSDLHLPLPETVKSRFSWLFVNLGTALLAASVIGLFEGTIARVVALAVLMPIVAGMGGNAGTQTLTVAVRALAMKELTPANARRIILKELAVGLLNGLGFAILGGAAAGLWFGSPRIGAVLGTAMLVNLTVAALAGILIPLTLQRLSIDPAVASGVFLTTVTDVVGFFSFLGLATAFLI